MPKDKPKVTVQAWFDRLREGQITSFLNAKKSLGKLTWRKEVKEAARIVAESYFRDGKENFDPSRIIPFLERKKSARAPLVAPPRPAVKTIDPVRTGMGELLPGIISATASGLLSPVDRDVITHQFAIIEAAQRSIEAYRMAKSISDAVDVSEVQSALDQLGTAWSVLGRYTPIILAAMPAEPSPPAPVRSALESVPPETPSAPAPLPAEEEPQAETEPIVAPPGMRVGDPTAAIQAALKEKVVEDHKAAELRGKTATNGVPAAKRGARPGLAKPAA